MWVSESAVFAQAADDDGDAGEEEHQTYNDPRHHQRRHQERRLPAGLPLAAAVWVLPMALVGAHCRRHEKRCGSEPKRGCVSVSTDSLDQVGKIAQRFQRSLFDRLGDG